MSRTLSSKSSIGRSGPPSSSRENITVASRALIYNNPSNRRRGTPSITTSDDDADAPASTTCNAARGAPPARATRARR